MKSKRSIALMWGIALVPIILLTIVYGRLPETVPTNFGFDGTVNSYGPKAMLWMLAGMGAMLAAMFQFMPRIDPKKHSYAKFQAYYDGFAIFMELFFLGINCLVLTEILRPGTVSMGRTVTVLLCLLFLFVGNMMGKVKNNYFFGIKTPWTLADPDVWNRTHRAGGRIWFVIGVLLLPCSLMLQEKVVLILLLAGVIGSTLLLYVLSYVWYRKRHGRSGDGENGGRQQDG